MIPVLDQCYVRLVEKLGSDWSPLRSARVSTDTDTDDGGEMTLKDKKLIQYLLDNGHTSPFESIVLTFEIKAPIFVVRQWHRHRTWSYNELSGRYSELPAAFYIPAPDKIGKQGKLNKQSRDTCADIDEDVVEQLEYFTSTCEASNDDYQYLLKEGWPREIARAVLPVNWYTRMYATVNLHNLFHFLKLRDHSHAQYEIREYAKAINRIISAEFPIIWNAWQKSKQSKYVKGVRQFHEKFELGYEGPARWIPDMHEFRAKFLQEEVDEYREAVSERDMVKAFDALIDIVYVAIGTAYLHGFPIDEGFDAVQEANMLKKRVASKEQSKRDSAFDVVKPEGWVSPEEKLEDLLRETNPCLS